MKQLSVLLLLAALVSCDRAAEETVSENAAEEIDAELQDAEPEVEVAEPAPVRTGDPVTDDIELAHQLGVMRGRLVAFVTLYRIGEYDSAAAHLMSADSAAYAALMPAFEARGGEGFAGPLAQLNASAAARGNVEAPYAALVAAIDANIPPLDVRERLIAVAEMLRSAGADFSASVDETGAVISALGYQQAYGETKAARQMLTAASTSDIGESEAIAVAHELLDQVDQAFPALTASETEGDPFLFVTAADQIERAALR